MISNSHSVLVPNTRSLSPFNQPKLSVGALAKSKLSLLKYFILFKQEEYPFKMGEGSNGSLRSRTYIPLWTLPLPRALNNVGNLRIILSETLMAWREGRGGSEVSDKMPTWGEFYQSLQNPPWKGFVWKRALAMTELATWWPLEPLYLAGKRGLVSLWGRFPLVTVFCRVCKAPLPTTIMLLLLAISQILFKRYFMFGWVFGKNQSLWIQSHNNTAERILDLYVFSFRYWTCLADHYTFHFPNLNHPPCRTSLVDTF